MELGLQGKVVLVTDGSKRIGFACAKALAAEGAHVAIASRASVERALVFSWDPVSVGAAQ